MNRDDERWMRRALRLASLSNGATWPNPGVGAVIVREGRLLGQGRHEVCGLAHAEINALADCRARGNDPRGATIYITLAPCTRRGRQPPCVDGLATAGIKRVVAAIADPGQDDPAEKLRAGGMTYEVGCLSHLAEHVHGGFLRRIREGRPRFTGKWAMTLDGSIAAASGDSAWISDDDALSASRRRRRAFDAIVVGAETVTLDDPRLMATRPRAKGPVRIVVSAQASLPDNSTLLATADQAPVWLLHGPNAPTHAMIRLQAKNITLLPIDDPHDPKAVAQLLGQRGLNDVLIEGGARMHGAWLRAGLYDRVECYVGAKTFGGGLPVADGRGIEQVAQALQWRHEVPPRAYASTTLLRMKRC